MRHVEVLPYDSIWQHLYLEEAKRLKLVFDDALVQIHHIGSTAVPGLSAKPIIDMMVVVKDIGTVDYYNEAMEILGYVAKGENGIENRRLFIKGGDERTHHVHVYQAEDENILRHLAFRDYLRTFNGEMERYSDLKIELAKLYPYDIDSYIKGKDIFVKVMEYKAVNWYQEQICSNL